MSSISINTKAQNLVKNPSFEITQEQPDNSGIYLLPKTLSFVYPPDLFEPPDYNDEITRCLGDYNNNGQPQYRKYPNPENRNLSKSNGGCNGCYNPLNEIINLTEGSGSTPDYFNKNVNPNNNLQRMVYVPTNHFNNYGNNSDGDKQFPYDDNSNGQSDEEAYIGLWNTRIYNDTTDEFYNYSEYITQRFENPLITNKVYILRFRVSWTKNGAQTEGNPRQTGHYLKGIGAYFSSTDPFVNRRNSSIPLNLEDRVYGLVYNYDYFTDEPKYYFQTGGSTGTNWETVYNQFTPEEDKSFITIGNFQLDWSRDDRVRYIGSNQNYIPNDGKLRVYYFIDGVEVFEKPTSSLCECERIYNVLVEPILKESRTGDCCYRVLLNTYYTPDLCHANKVKIYLANADGTNKTFKYQYTTSPSEYLDFANNLVLYGNLCFNKNEKGQLKKIIIELYYNNEQLCEKTSNIFEVQCLCGCEEEEPLDFNISLKPFEENPNYNGCCWNLELKNESNDCDFSVKDIFVNFDSGYDGDLEFTPTSPDFNMIHLGPGRYKFTNTFYIKTIEKGSTVILGKICTAWGTDPIQISMTYSTEDGVCDREWNEELNCPDCCQSYEVDIIQNAIYYNDGYCCYPYSIQIDPFSGCMNELKVIKILDNNNFELWSSSDYSSTPPPLIIDGILCISKSNFNGQLKIQFYNKLGQKVCEKLQSVNYCSDPEPCYPDYQNVPWSEPIRKINIGFKCSDGSWCNLDYTYRWRIVKSGGSVLHRDIQITSYKLGYCSCPNEIESHIDAMIKDAWNDQTTISGFELYPPNINNWNVGETRCFNDFRVVTSDCWEEQFLDQIHRRRCNDVQCCYAVYRVCYTKVPPVPGTIKFLSYDKINESNIIPQPCQAGCEPQECAKWRPEHGDEYEIGAPPRVTFDNPEDIKNQDCYVYTKSNKNLDEHFINLECARKGNVILFLFDLLGNLVSSKETTKSDFILSIALDENIISGIYLIKISIDNDFIYFNKINIVK